VFEVNSLKCVGCWGCVNFCPQGAIAQGIRTAEIFADMCNDCGRCASVCPLGAISRSAKRNTGGKDTDHRLTTTNYQLPISNTREYDVVIIGGGPGGLSAAYFAARAGLSVLAIEKRNALGMPVACAEGISAMGLARTFTPRAEWIGTTVEGAILVSPGGKHIFIDHPHAGYILNRPAMERDIAAMAANAGAEILTGAAVVRIEGKKSVEKLVVSRDGHRLDIRGKFYIGADGIGGPSARWTHPSEPFGNEDFNTCAQVLLSADGIDEHIPEMHWGNNIAPGGYVWVFGKGNGLANVGLGVVPALCNGATPQQFLNKFLRRRFGQWRIIERRDGVVPAARRLRPPGRANMLLVGDAARMPNAISGAGIDIALFSGKLAAECIVEMHRSAPKKIISQYARRWQKSMGKQLDFYFRLRKGVIRFSDNELDSIAEFLMPRLCGKVWDALDIPAIVMDIVFSQPRLLKLARHFMPKIG